MVLDTRNDLSHSRASFLLGVPFCVAPRVVTTLRGVADLAVSPNGRFVIAAVSTAGAGGISMVDTATGKTEEIVRGSASISPQCLP